MVIDNNDALEDVAADADPHAAAAPAVNLNLEGGVKRIAYEARAAGEVSRYCLINGVQR